MSARRAAVGVQSRPNHVWHHLRTRDAPGEIVMFLATAPIPRSRCKPCKPFLAMDAPGLRRANSATLHSDDQILADPAGRSSRRSRGFILLQRHGLA